MTKESEKTKTTAQIVERDIVPEMKESYLDYAMSVITARALPDARDGLKPVQRRILFAMQEIGLSAAAKTRKSAKIVGDVTGNYHPHGDTAVYEALVKLAQPFVMRYPLIIGQGNFGSIDGDNAAAPRYTEAKMSRLAGELLKDLDKGTVNWRPNYEGTRKEPTVLPAAAPNLLLNGTLGIAVGMATNIPPHNLKETVAAAAHLIDRPEATTEDLLQFVKGPDFPTGGVIFNQKDIQHCYATGRGGVVTRGEAEIIELKNGQSQIVISSIPYRVNKADLIVKIADLVREKKIDGIKGLRDESAKELRITVDLKNNAQPQKVLNYLYKHTQLEEVFHFNLVALSDGVPKTLSLKSLLEEFLEHRRTVVRRRTEFDLEKAKEREHILLGLKKALDHIDRIIKLIKSSRDAKDAHQNLKKEFKFSDRQATAILEMKLQKLAGLERKQLEDELKTTQKLIEELSGILASRRKISDIIKKELLEVAEKYGDERRTRVVKTGVWNLEIEDLIAEEENALVLTAGGYLKRTKPEEFRRQKRGGVGVVDLDTKEEDFVTTLLKAGTHDDLLFFTDRGRVYQTKMYELPEGRRATRGKSIMNFLPLETGEKITSLLPLAKEDKQLKLSVLMITEQGLAKKVKASSFFEVRRGGIIALRLSAGDRLVAVQLVQSGDQIIAVTAGGQSIRFKESDLRDMGRTAGGVRAMRLGRGDSIISAQVVRKEFNQPTLLVVSAGGFGKRTPLKEYKVQKRGGSGIKTSRITPKTGRLIAAKVVSEEEELVAISQKSQVLRTSLQEVPILGRQTQGVRIMKLREKDKIASLTCF